MKKTTLIWTLIIFLLLPQLTKAQGVSLTEKPLQNIILEQGNVSFSVEITNNQDNDDTFRFIFPSIYEGWRIQPDPTKITIPKQSSKTITLYIIPTKKPKPDNYGFGITLKSNTNESVFTEHTFKFKVITHDQAIETNLITPESINPNKENLFRLNLKNKYNLSIKNIKVILENEYFKEEKTVSLGPFAEVTKEFLINFNPPVEKGDSEVRIKILANNKEVINRKQTITIGDYKIIESSESPLSGFLIKKEKVLKTNNGNTIANETYTKKIGFFEKPFTKTNIPPTKIEKQGKYYLYTWEFELGPGETRLIEIETNYRYFALALLILLILAFYIYKEIRRDLSITKKLAHLKRAKDGITTLNIILSIKNKSNKPINNIKIIDVVPYTIEKPYNFGSLQPKIIQQHEKSTRMIWEIRSIGKKQEIVLSYTAKTKIPLLLNVKLPPAVAKYLINNKRFLVKSNKLQLFS
jgi:hypothetical protein